MALIENKRAGFDYEILEEIESGIELLGTEVKSLRDGHGSLKGARVVARGGEAYLVGATIPAWQIANAATSYDPERPRRLLLHQKEILRIASAESEKGLTIIPLEVYTAGRFVKARIAIVRGKGKSDKREDLKKKDAERETGRVLKNR